jgi:hypothetical protein
MMPAVLIMTAGVAARFRLSLRVSTGRRPTLPNENRSAIVLCHREERSDVAIPIKARSVMEVATSLRSSR